MYKQKVDGMEWNGMEWNAVLTTAEVTLVVRYMY